MTNVFEQSFDELLAQAGVTVKETTVSVAEPDAPVEDKTFDQ